MAAVFFMNSSFVSYKRYAKLKFQTPQLDFCKQLRNSVKIHFSLDFNCAIPVKLEQ